MESVYKESVRKNLIDAMEYYAGCTLGFNLKQMSNQNVRLLQKNITSFLVWCNMKRQQHDKDGLTEKSSSYYEVVSHVLAAYVDTSLCLSKIMSPKRRLEESSTILLKTSLVLSNKVHHYLDVILNLRYLDESHLDLMKPICRKCLTQKLNSDPVTYTKLIILHKKTKMLWPKELTSELMESSMLLPPKNYLKWLMDRNPEDLLKNKTSLDDKKVRDHLIGHVKVEALESFLQKVNKKIRISLPPSTQSALQKFASGDDIDRLSDDEIMKINTNNCSRSDDDDDDDDVNFWGKKSTTIVNIVSPTLKESDDESEVVAMETESVEDDSEEMDTEHSANEIDLTCDDDDDDQQVKQAKMNEEVVLETNTISPWQPEVKSLKRKHESDDDDDDEECTNDGETPKHKKTKHSHHSESTEEQIDTSATSEVTDPSMVVIGDKDQDKDNEMECMQEDSKKVREDAAIQDVPDKETVETTEEINGLENKNEEIQEIITDDTAAEMVVEDDDDMGVKQVETDVVHCETHEENHGEKLDKDEIHCDDDLHHYGDDDDDEKNNTEPEKVISNIDDLPKVSKELQASQNIEEVVLVTDAEKDNNKSGIPKESEDIISSVHSTTDLPDEVQPETSSSSFTQLKDLNITSPTDMDPDEKSAQVEESDVEKVSSCSDAQVEREVQKKYSLRSTRSTGNSETVKPEPSKSRLRRPLSRKPSQSATAKSSTNSDVSASQESKQTEMVPAFVSLEDVIDTKVQKKRNSEASHLFDSPKDKSSESTDQEKGASKIPRWFGKNDEEAEVSGSSTNSDAGPRRSARIKGKDTKQ